MLDLFGLEFIEKILELYPEIATHRNWHIYGWEWTDEYAKWWINGKLVNTLYKNQSRRPELWPDENMYIILNNGVRAAAPASDESTIWPNQLEIDYIELYQRN